MPVYTYNCKCGVRDFQQFLKDERDKIVLKCVGCGRGVSARQIHDKSVSYSTKDQVTGVMRSGDGKRL